MNEEPAAETAAVRQAWGRIAGWLEHHAPDVFAALGGPGSPAAIDDAEERMGLQFPAEMRQLLLMNDVTAGRRRSGVTTLVALGCDVDLPGGGLLLGLVDIERVHGAMTDMQRNLPDDPDYRVWHRDWLPIAADTDGFHGTFLDTRVGSVGSWCEASRPVEDEYASLAEFLHVAADRLEGVSSGGARRIRGGRAGRRTPSASGPCEASSGDEAIRLWARAHDMLVNDAGRIPTSIRDAYRVATNGVVGGGPVAGNG